MVKALANSLGTITDDPRDIKEMVNDFYQNLYTFEGVSGVDDVLVHVPETEKVTTTMNDILCTPYTSKEVKTALFQMFPTKAPVRMVFLHTSIRDTGLYAGRRSLEWSSEL